VRPFEPAWIGCLELPNRLVRSATFEGLCDAEGCPGPAYVELYAQLAAQGLGALITGFAFTSRDGRAMQPGQAGLDADARIAPFTRVTQAVHRHGGRIFLQLAHAGRQTVPAATGGRIYAPSTRKSSYFNQRPERLTEPHLERIITDFAAAARRAQTAGFDGVQLHAAHGYLLHQFLHPAINDRTDDYGLDPRTGIGTAFLGRVIDRIRSKCGPAFPLLIKISAGDDYRRSFAESEFIHLVRFLEARQLSAIEISYGTMDQALNIFRGQSIPVNDILAHNPRYATRSAVKRFVWRTLALPWLRRNLRPFIPMYNLAYAQLAKAQTKIPIMCVGGFRSGAHIRTAIAEKGLDFVSLARPLLCEPDFALQVRRQADYVSRCRNCNRCAVLCDAGLPTRCHARAPSEKELPHETRR